jgi:hypothetical protein
VLHCTRSLARAGRVMSILDRKYDARVVLGME